jgi:outer membrane protein OmpA-like peptidoglycan-associated protein
MSNRYLLGAGVAVAVAFSWANAQAQLLGPGGPGAWYFGGETGWTMLEDQTGTLTVKGAPDPSAALGQGFNDGFNAGVRAGYEWGPWRFEEEFRFMENPLSSVTLGPSLFLGPGGTTTAVSGARDAYAFMTNAIYDFNVGWALTPHLGAGIGAVTLHDSISLKPFSLFAPGPGGKHVSSSSTTEFGYQGIAGVRYNINPSLAFDLDYRYLATTDPTFTAKASGFGFGSYSSGYSTHSIVASLSVRFGAPPPMMAAPPMPGAPPMIARKVFLVFFDWDRDTITPEGMAIIQQAAAAFRAGGPITIQVTGYADRSGSPGYNQRLSERRANNVANAMVRIGVPRSQMAVSGRGENDNRVPTADGVREPQNRRVEIVFP